MVMLIGKARDPKRAYADLAYGSIRDLWQLLSGSFQHLTQDAAKQILLKERDKLTSGLQFFGKQNSPTGEKLKRERKLEKNKLDFILKLSKFLALDEVICCDLFLTFMSQDYRGSQRNLQCVVESARQSHTLLLKIRDFYHSERIYLLHTIKHILNHHDNSKHRFHKVFEDFLEPLFEGQSFTNKLLEQYESLCDEPAPSSHTHGPFMTEREAAQWLAQNLREQCELLEILLLAFTRKQLPTDKLLQLLQRFKRQGFGRRQLNKHLIDETSESVLQKIGFLQSLLALRGFRLNEITATENDSSCFHQILESNKFKELSSLATGLGDMAEHSPVLLAVSLLLQLSPDDHSSLSRKLGHSALQHRVFYYLATRLRQHPFSADTDLSWVCHSLVGDLLTAALMVYLPESLGDKQDLNDCVSAVLQNKRIAHRLLENDLDEGLGVLVENALSQFPLYFSPPLQLLMPVAKASRADMGAVVSHLHQLTVFMEYMDGSMDVGPVRGEQGLLELRRDRQPYPPHSSFVIPARTRGILHTQAVGIRDVLQWQIKYSAFDVFLGECRLLLKQLHQGAGMVQSSCVDNVLMVSRMIQTVMSDDAQWAVDNIPQLPALFDALHQTMHRLCQIGPSFLELLAAILDVLSCEVSLQAEQVWQTLLHSGLLPFLTENIDNYSEAVSGAGVNTGAYGKMLVACECSEGKYPVSLALLPLLSSLIPPLNQVGRVDELMAVVIFLSRELFPSFHKWRFYLVNSREKLGQRCLNIFHQILNILPDNPEDKKTTRPGVREVCVYSLLFTEAGRTLLDIIGLGVDTIETALTTQSSVQEGLDVELIQLVRLAVSVLNRLLLLRPADLPISPTERCLSSQPVHLQDNSHPMATIARYIYHRHDQRLPALTTLLLKRLAMVFPMSLLACLGNEAEAIRDIYLSRLKASNQGVRLKVVVLELLSVCVDSQPGLIEIFLNIETPSSTQTQQALHVGESSCLLSILNLIGPTKQLLVHCGRSSAECLRSICGVVIAGHSAEDRRHRTSPHCSVAHRSHNSAEEEECPSELLCAAVQFVHALWRGRRETAMAALRRKEEFWPSVCLSLTRNLVSRTEEVTSDMLSTDMQTVAYIMKVLALELYHVPSSKIDAGLLGVLGELMNTKKVEYWSKYLCEAMRVAGRFRSRDTDEGGVDRATLQMLLAWRELLLVLAAGKADALRLTDKCRSVILHDILAGMKAQFGQSLTPLQLKLASVASACFFTLLKPWTSALGDPWQTMVQLEGVLSETVKNSEVLLPSVQIGILSSLTLILQQQPTAEKSEDMQSLLDVVCCILQQSTYQLPSPLPTNSRTNIEQDGKGSSKDSKAKEMEKDFDIKMKFQCVTLCLLEEVVRIMRNPCQWLPLIQRYSTASNLIHSLLPYIQARQGLTYVRAALHFLNTLAANPQGAELVTSAGLSQQLCIVLSELCTEHNTPPLVKTSSYESDGWRSVYVLYTRLMTSLLISVKFAALPDCLNFVGVHQVTMHQCLCSVGVDDEVISEAVETTRFLSELAHYHRDWRLHLLPSMQTLMGDISVLSNRCVSLLIRPRLLQHIQEGSSLAYTEKAQQLVSAPVVRRLSSQSSSTDDTDSVSQATMILQQRLLELLSHCLAAMQQFSPDLCEILLDQSLDVSEYDSCLDLAFSTPAVDTKVPASFGTLVSVLNMALKLLPKTVGGSVSPVKGLDIDSLPFKKNIILYVMEMSVMLMMEQAVRYLKQPVVSTRDKQLLKRELGAELTSFRLSFQRHLRRAPGSPASASLLPSPQPSSSKLQVPSSSALSSSSDYSFFRLVDVFINQVLR